MRPENVEAIYPLSPLQQGLLFHTLLAPRSGVYFVQVCADLNGTLNVEALEQAWIRVVERHAVLRTFFIWEDVSKPVQVVQKTVTLPIEVLDWRELGDEEKQQRLANYLRIDRKQGFELARAPLMRLGLMRLADDCHTFVWSYHHLLLDGWCLSLVLRDVLLFYGAFSEKRDLQLEPGPTYRDYIAWLQRQDLSEAEKFWRRTLEGFTTPTPFGVDRISASVAAEDQDYDSQVAVVSRSATATLQRLTRTHKLTMNTIVQGAWALLLSCYSHQKDVLFGTTVSGRPADLPGVESIVGLFINTLPVRVRIRRDESLFTWLQELQHQQVEARQYEYSPLLEVQRWSDVPRGQSLFSSTITFENYPVNVSTQRPADNTPSRQQHGLGVGKLVTLDRPHYPLSVTVVPEAELVVKIVYDRGRFDEATITRMLEHFTKLLEKMAARPQARVGELSIISGAELAQQVVEWNQTASEIRGENVVELFAEQVRRTPEHVAVVFGETRVRYVELNERAEVLAAELRGRGVGPEIVVGLLLERSVDLVVAMLGVLKAGGAYLPLDPAYPEERLQFIIDDAKPKVILTADDMDQSRGADPGFIRRFDPCHLCAGNLAYVIYTSGSTGKPKGTLITHGGLLNYVSWAMQTYPLAAGMGTPLHSSVSFDLTVTSIYPALLSGGYVEIIPEAEGVPGLASALARQPNYSLVKLTPAHVQLLATQLAEQEAANLTQALVIGGENLLAETVSWWREHAPQTRLFNEYGPTETVVGCCVYEVQAETDWTGSIPIGKPIANTRLYLLDETGQPVPLGVTGELYIGGAGVGCGYLNRAELTAERFLPDAYSGEAGARLYRTGDLARYRAGGVIEYLGRMDEQVKVRGYRVELGEIEAVLSGHEKVSEAVVIVREEGGEKRLVAYIVGEAEITALKRYLQERLPEYMIPSAWLTLDQLPLARNGKVDRKALPRPDAHRPELSSPYITPRSATEQAIAEVWQEVLGIESVGVDDNFFDLGGHSLDAVRVHAMLKARFGDELSLVQLFQFPTISSLAALLRQETSDEPSFEKVYERANKQREAIAQQRHLKQERTKIYGY